MIVFSFKNLISSFLLSYNLFQDTECILISKLSKSLKVINLEKGLVYAYFTVQNTKWLSINYK